ncbi:MAG TPA: transcription elongation factor subunit Spt4 [Candidatus Norongarragalinales archaeon]|nr:transcription elongation factor subunit Spt4 [Candidatus Norongarragalinales archaeon]
MEKACRKCRRIVQGDVCPVDQGTDLTKTFEGYIVILDPEHSEVAKAVKAATPGKYALKIK